jgi:hypothetical protein
MISEELIMSYLNNLLESSEPGATMHHLYVVSAPAGAVGPLGLPDESQAGLSVYAIAPTAEVDVEQFIARTVATAGTEHAAKGRVVLFAALSQEAWAVKTMDALARRLLAEGRLFEHPDMVEMTMVYGACRDGRRWRARRWLTGADAGQTEDVELLVGRVDPREGRGPATPLVRKLVGLS